MVLGVEIEQAMGMVPFGDRDRVLLEAFSRRGAYWTTDLALLAGYRTTGAAYRALERLEERNLVQRVVRLDPISWRRTELGDIVANTFPADIGFRVAS
jgi:hypothetical protein